MTTETLSRRDQRRNYILGVLNGTIFKGTMLLIDSQMVLAWFLMQLGVSNFLIGLILPIRMGSSFVLQITASGHLQQKPYKLPFYRAMAVVRCLALLGIAVALVVIPVHSAWLVIAFFVLLTLYSMGSGLTGLAFMDTVAKSVPPTRRGGFFSQRSFLGGLVALGASALVGYILAEPGGLVFPLNIALLVVLALITLAVAAGLWSITKEPPSEVVPERVRWIDQVRRGGRLLVENGPYRRYMLVYVLMVLGGAANAFYIVYAKSILGISAQMVGVYLTARTAASIVSNLFWGRISDRMGNRRLFQVTTAFGVSMPLLALGIGTVGSRVPAALPWLPWVYALVFVVSGAFVAASNIAISGYMLDLAPPAQRSLYLGFSNTLLGVARFAALASGLIVAWAGFTGLLALSALLYGLALTFSLSMVEPRAEQRRVPALASRPSRTEA
jgi:MFS family permease